MSTKGLSWFRAYADMIDDEKLRLLAFEDRWHFVAILCCKCAGLLDAGDALPQLRRKMAVKLGLASRELDAMVDRLGELGLIDALTFQPVGWDGRQFQSDTSSDRVRAFRERQAQVKRACNVSETGASVSVSETEPSEAKEQQQEPRASRFEEFWAVYPNKADKKDARKRWISRKLDTIADVIIADVKLKAAKDDGWLRGFVPLPTTYINGDRWEDALRTAAQTATPGYVAPPPARTTARPEQTRVELDATKAKAPADPERAKAAIAEALSMIGSAEPAKRSFSPRVSPEERAAAERELADIAARKAQQAAA